MSSIIHITMCGTRTPVCRSEASQVRRVGCGAADAGGSAPAGPAVGCRRRRPARSRGRDRCRGRRGTPPRSRGRQTSEVGRGSFSICLSVGIWSKQSSRVRSSPVSIRWSSNEVPRSARVSSVARTSTLATRRVPRSISLVILLMMLAPFAADGEMGSRGGRVRARAHPGSGWLASAARTGPPTAGGRCGGRASVSGQGRQARAAVAGLARRPVPVARGGVDLPRGVCVCGCRSSMASAGRPGGDRGAATGGDRRRVPAG